MPKGLRWAVLKNSDGYMTKEQEAALVELTEYDYDTASAWRIKEKLRWVRQAKTIQAAKWRLTHFINYSELEIGNNINLKPVAKALTTVKKHADRILQRWSSTYSNARMEGLNGLFQAARSRARGYRNTETFITMIYMICSPVRDILKST